MAENERHEIEPLWFTFDGPPGPVAGRFVEVENERGQSRSAGKWVDNGGGYWTCGPFVTVDDHKKAVAYERASAREEGRRAGLEEARGIAHRVAVYWFEHAARYRCENDEASSLACSTRGECVSGVEAAIRALIGGDLTDAEHARRNQQVAIGLDAGQHDCTGCTDPRSEGTHQMGTRQHPLPGGDK